MAPGFLKILIASMQRCLFIRMHFICMSLFLKPMVHMLGYVPYITTGFRDFRKPVSIQ